MERGASEAARRAFTALEETVVRFTPAVFQMGARLEDLPRALRALDVSERLSLGSLLKPTPPRWVFLPAFAIASRPVTNSDYLRFLEDSGYEDSARWQRVFEDHAVDQVDHYALRGAESGNAAEREAELRGSGDAEFGLLRKTWETYTSVRSFPVAFLRSVLFECERELDLSPCFAEKRTIWDEAKTMERPRAPELAQIVALAVRALAPSLPADFRRELAHDEREKLAALDAEAAATEKPARKRALEALDAIIGRLRDHYLASLRAEGSVRVAPESERGLVERDYLAPDFQIATLKFLDRLRVAHAREEERIPLRRLIYPLAWPSEDPRALSRERTDRLPWAERPVQGISLYEALAYADWVSRAAGGDAVVRLPNEAEHERASSWPVLSSPVLSAPVLSAPVLSADESAADAPAEDGVIRETVDRRWKMLFPWEVRAAADPASTAPEAPPRSAKKIFSDLDRSPFELELGQLRELVRRTARPVGERRLEMLLGFQWEWTRDRLAELETGYEHLDRNEPLDPRHEVWELDKDEPVRATHYRGSARRGAWFAVRGAPRRVGGCALTTRRYGLSPLRGVPDCGFRLVIEPIHSRGEPQASAAVKTQRGEARA
jgi:formylglycine-generating enzyme required for sulfatase activity